MQCMNDFQESLREEKSRLQIDRGKNKERGMQSKLTHGQNDPYEL